MQLKHTQKKICTVYGEGAVTDQICQMWFVKLHATDYHWMILFSQVD